MSGTYDDLAPLRVGDDMATEGEPEPDQRPAAHRQVPITVVEPEGNARGGIVLLHESGEFTGPLLELMRALAAEGWTVVAPNLFHRATDTPSTGVFGDELFEDFDACFDWLTRHGVFPDCIGALGFDTAGTAAFLVATNRPIGAAVSVAAPGIVSPLTGKAEALVQIAPSLQAPWLGLFGDTDPTTPPTEVEQLRDAAARASVASLVISYPGLLHRADKPGDDDEDERDDLVDAQTRIFDWFDSNLR
ncbi:carboxymethylenebutenolidase [Nocardia cyriacigeorgica]|uniref:Carboxymethylenebutenolidase n=1 Tax=Nocardia cyriacigeorgica TaxID=135487 RepID=A0A6P1DCC6_9NOCA|nr:dienelactone hydrolase family protein [Nocardia cyriacigeorgica]NEW38208.1 carboxymethylenebutenolidase [Nocardia cyriacigeorgica]NEW47251.1 carboxymethylenebutenolidase [Nocardia cyriacigeorgica]NEW52653.1 carboxymethylenebutenolidase [Nocardia cyriacigeorgica]NEW57645.1 carboxymethylenebutenolidase [Nocardia cyriacigeorgica]